MKIKSRRSQDFRPGALRSRWWCFQEENVVLGKGELLCLQHTGLYPGSCVLGVGKICSPGSRRKFWEMRVFTAKSLFVTFGFLCYCHDSVFDRDANS